MSGAWNGNRYRCRKLDVCRQAGATAPRTGPGARAEFDDAPYGAYVTSSSSIQHAQPGEPIPGETVNPSAAGT